MAEVSICGAINLLSAIFGVERDALYERFDVPNPDKHPCPQCGKLMPNYPYRVFCSAECSYEYHHPLLACSECGILFERKLSQITASNESRGYKGTAVFCSRKCQGKWVGRNYGFVAHPENMGRLGWRKWDVNQVLHLRLDTGWGCLQISRALGIPTSTISQYLRNNG